MDLAVLGAGAWGTALAANWGKQHVIKLWTRTAEVVTNINKYHVNHSLLPGVILPSSLTATNILADVCNAELLVIATPMSGLRDVLQALKMLYSNKVMPPLAWVCKGVEAGTMLLPHQVVHNVLGYTNGVVLSGPSFAIELAKGLPTAITMGSADNTLTKHLSESLSTSALRIYTSSDVVGIEVGGALKNVLAIAAGISDGLALGYNARAALLTRGLAESVRLCESLGGFSKTLMGLSGLGDLILTCTADLSRNRRMGLALGSGRRLQEIIHSSGYVVVEGLSTATEVARLSVKLRVDMPIACTVAAVIKGDIHISDAVSRLMGRSLCSE